MDNSRYSILIICEGEKTEPLFYNSIRDAIIRGTYDVDIAIKILPEPRVIDAENLEEVIEISKHKKVRKKRELKKAIEEEPEIIDEAPPLKWVLTGKRELLEGTYNEVWAVFDHDNHPKRKEAFEEAEKEINGQKVRIAFSSRSFEYYLLLHFDRIYKTFLKTDCKENREPINCGTFQNENDCNGNLCINGYAKIHKYWEATKSDYSVFNIIRDRLKFGFESSEWLRFISASKANNEPLYERNPYILDVDILVKKITGNESYNCIWISDTIEIKGFKLTIIKNQGLTIQNISNSTKLINANSFLRVDILLGSRISFGERKILYPKDSYNLSIEKHDDRLHEYFAFQVDNDNLLFDIYAHLLEIRNIVEHLQSLTHKDLLNLRGEIKNNLVNK